MPISISSSRAARSRALPTLSTGVLVASTLVVRAPPAAAQTGPIEVIATNITTSATSLVPGGSGARYAGFNDLSVSVDGEHVLLEAFTFEFSGGNDYLILDGTVLFKEGTSPLPWDASQTWRRGHGHVNRDGALAVASGGISATPIGQSPRLWVAQRDAAGAWSVLHTESSGVPGVPGANFTEAHDPFISELGSVGFTGEVEGAVSGTRRVAYFEGGPLVQASVTVPNGSAGGFPIGGIDLGPRRGFQCAVDDGAWSLTSNMLVVNGRVELQSGVVLPFGSFTEVVSGVVGQHLDPLGRWFAWGVNHLSNHEWLVGKGVLLAEEGDPVVPGSSLTWAGNGVASSAPAFVDVAGHPLGAYVVAGRTLQGPSVLVANLVEIVAQTGDPIDLDGNGFFDDDAFFERVVFLGGWTEDDRIHAVVELQRGDGSNLGLAVVRIFHFAFSPCALVCDGVPNSTGGAARMRVHGLPSAVLNEAALHVDGLPQNTFGLFFGGPAPGPPTPLANSIGLLCISGPLGRFQNPPVVFTGPTGEASAELDLTRIPTATGFTDLQAGDTRVFQLWYRDSVGGSPTSNLSGATTLTVR
ncbi:MAG: hypothetical protein AAFU73_01010 [Planctomycetota bacterium]